MNQAPGTKHFPPSSIVIATADRPQMVLDCVRRLATQVPAEVEVIVVDAGAEAPVVESALRGLWPNSKVLHSPVRNAGAQRNMGVAAARGEVIVFLDDDSLVQSGWWPAIVAPLAGCGIRDTGCGVKTTDYRPETIDPTKKTAERGPEDGPSLVMEPRTSDLVSLVPNPESRISDLPFLSPPAAVAGAVWCNPSPRFTDKRGGYVNWRGEPIQVTHRSAGAPRDVDWPMTTNMAVRRDVMMRIGGFCEAYGIYDEDVDLGLKIRRAGWGIVFVPEAAVYHYYLSRPRKPPTKHSEFTLGRNRSMLLVRHFGFSGRFALFLLTAPWMVMWRTIKTVAHAVWTAVGHGMAYMVGVCAGVIAGVRYPVSKDGPELRRKEDGR